MAGCLNLIIQYVNDPRPERQAEFEECVRRNLANPFVETIHNLQERADVLLPEEFTNHPKYRRHDLNRWMTFADAFAYAGAELAGQVCAILNLDIFLDPTAPWPEMPEIFQEPMVFCLTRHEYDLDGRTWIDPTIDSWQMANSQDGWFFKAPIVIKNCDFGVGVMGCDNAIAHRIKESRYLPVNAARRFRIFHLDRVRGKTVANHEQIYSQERQGSAIGPFPERQGQYLLPEIDAFESVDELLLRLNSNRMAKYSVICDTVNKFVHLDNMSEGDKT
jgi:hypothetical protein